MNNISQLRLVVLVSLGMVGMQTAAFEVKPVGRLHLDYAVHDADVTPLEDDGLVRRARIGLDGEFNEDWAFQIEYDFTNGGEAKDVFVRYGGWAPADITVGQLKVPFGLEELTGANNIMFIERSLPSSVFPQSRRLGVGLDRNGENYTIAAMGFGKSIDGDEGHGVGARFTFTPIEQEDTVVHLGLAATTERPEAEVRFGAYPESRPADIRLVDTDELLDVDRINQLGLESAWKSGPFSAQMEWMHSDVSRGFGLPDLEFDGWYVAGSWVLTGESRGYRDGRFRGISTDSRRGAWELTARYSHINLDSDAVLGGKEDNVTLGVNWYAREYVRVMANLIMVSSERMDISDDPKIFLVRVQFAF